MIRFIPICRYCILVSCVELLGIPATFAQEEHRKAYPRQELPPKLQSILTEDFSTNRVSTFETLGRIAWEPGKMVLGPSAAIGRTSERGCWAKFAFEVSQPRPDTRHVGWGISLRFLFDDATACVIRIRWADDHQNKGFRMGLYDMVPNWDVDEGIAEQLVHESEFREFPRRIQVEYRWGLVKVFGDSKKLLAAFVDNGDAVLKGFWFASDATSLELNNLDVSVAPTAIVEQQREIDKLTTTSKLEEEIYSHFENEQYKEALPKIKKTLEIKERILGKYSLSTLQSVVDLGYILYLLGQPEPAVQHLNRAIRMQELILGKDHPIYAEALMELGMTHQALEEYTKAQSHMTTAASITKNAIGKHGHVYRHCMYHLSDLFDEGGDEKQKAVIDRQIEEIENDPALADELEKEAQFLGTYEEFDQAAELFQQILEMRKATQGLNHPDYLRSLARHMRLRIRAEKFSDAKELLQLVKKINIQADQLEFDSRLDVARIYVRLQDEDRALVILKKSLRSNDLCEIDGTFMHIERLTRIANLYYSLADPIQAAENQLRAADIRRDLVGDDHPKYADDLCRIAMLLIKKNGNAKAKAYLEEALPIYTRTVGTSHPKFCLCAANLAYVSWQLGDHVRADSLCRQLMSTQLQLENRSDVWTIDHRAYAESLHVLGTLYERREDNINAVQMFKSAIHIYEQIGATLDRSYAQSLSDLALVHYNMRNIEAAEEFGQRASEIQKRRHMLIDYAHSQNTLGLVYDHKGEIAQAEPCFQRARRIYEAFNHASLGNVLANLASLHASIGDYSKADALIQVAIQLTENGENSVNLHLVLAAIYLETKQFAKADQTLNQALKRHESSENKSKTQYANLLNLLGLLHYRQFEFDVALPYFEKANALLEEKLGKNSIRLAAESNNLAIVHRAMGNHDEAVSLLRRAIALRRKGTHKPKADDATILNNLARAFCMQGSYDEAEPIFREVLEVTHKHIRETSSILSERQQRSLSRKNVKPLFDYLSLCRKLNRNADLAFKHVFNWKGATLLRQRTYREIAQKADTRETFRELRSIAAQLAFHLRQTKSEGWQDRYEELTTRSESLQRQLARKSQSFVENQKTLRVDDLLAVLPTSFALVEIIEYSHREFDNSPPEPRFLAFVVRHGIPTKMVDLGPSTKIRQAIDEWRQQITIVEPQNTHASRRGSENLKNAIWMPIERQLGDTKRVAISADGAIGRVSFDALPGRSPGSYLLEDYDITYVPVLQLLPRLMAESRPKNIPPRFLLMGDVDYDTIVRDPSPAPLVNSVDQGQTNRAPTSFVNRRWKRLPGTSAEVLAIERQYRRSVAHDSDSLQIVRGRQATEKKFRELAPKSDIIHVATHGFFAERKSRQLAVEDSRFDDTSLDLLGFEKQIRPDLLYHAGNSAGLVFSGANRQSHSNRSDDGILSAEEINFLPLDSAELVTLSACDTHLGTVVSGEGLLGIQRAFQISGAKSVIATLWKVDDRVTQRLMERFYANLFEKKQSKLEALREAKLWILKNPKESGALRGFGSTIVAKNDSDESTTKRSHPKFWAPFVLSGDWR